MTRSKAHDHAPTVGSRAWGMPGQGNCMHPRGSRTALGLDENGRFRTIAFNTYTPAFSRFLTECMWHDMCPKPLNVRNRTRCRLKKRATMCHLTRIIISRGARIAFARPGALQVLWWLRPLVPECLAQVDNQE